MAHFHREGLLRQDTVDALTLLQPHFDRIILVSTNLMDGEERKLPDSVELVVRNNVGYDFYSYREGIARLQATPAPWQLTLMNSSFVVTDAQLFARRYFVEGVGGQRFDCLGLTKSAEISEHVQSFLMTFSPQVVADRRFTDWWQRMVPLNERQQVVQAYEVGLSSALLEWGYTLSALLHYDPARLPNNPSHGAFLALLEDFGVIKIEVFKSNPCRLDLQPLVVRAKANADFYRAMVEGFHN